MPEIVIPGRGALDIRNLMLDLNGTLTLDGDLIVGVAERIARLRSLLNITLVTADTLGRASRLASQLDIDVEIVDRGTEAEQKVEFLRSVGASHTVAVGNGANDRLILEHSAIGVLVIGPEGASTSALLRADIVVVHINDALDLLLEPDRLIATLRV